MDNVTISRPATANIAPPADDPLPQYARLFVRFTADDKVELAPEGQSVDGVVEFSVTNVTGNGFEDDVPGVTIFGFPLLRIAENIEPGDELTPAAGGSGKAKKAVSGDHVGAIARTGAAANSDSPFVRAQLLLKGQYVKP
jgi:hypothetical protein